MKVTLSPDKQYLTLAFHYSPSVIAQVRLLEGRTWDKSARVWRLPLTSAGRSLARLEALGFAIDPEARVAIQQVDEKESRLRELARAVSFNVASSEFATSLPLYEFQKASAAFMVEATKVQGGCLNANPVQSGKTITTLAALKHLGCDRVLVLTPKTVTKQWQVQFKQWLGVDSTIIKGTALRRTSCYADNFVIMNYELLYRDFERMPRKWDAIIADEAHRIGNTRTRTHKAIVQLESSVRFALSATPIMNRALDLYGLASWLVPGYLGTFTQFVDRYCIRNIWGGIEGTSRPEELAARFAPLMVRHTWEEIGLQMPPVIEQDLVIDLSPTERSLYDRMRQELLFELKKEEVSKLSSPMILQNVLTKLGKLQECTDSLALLGESTESSKLNALRDHVIDVVASGEKVIVFSRFARMAKIIHKALGEYNSALLVGELDDTIRQNSIAKFKNDPTCRVFVSTEAGGVGLSLQVASIIYNYDFPFSVGKFEQRTGRVKGIGQGKTVHIYNLICAKTIDQHIKRILKAKLELSAALLDSEQWSGEEIMGLLEE